MRFLDAAASPTEMLPAADLQELIETVGTPGFAPALLRTAAWLGATDRIAAFSGSDTGSGQVLLAQSVTTDDGWTVPLDQAWTCDSATLLLAEDSSGNDLLVQFDPSSRTFGLPWYGAGERVTLIGRRSDALLRLDLMRERASGSFGQIQLLRLREAAGTLLSLLARHGKAPVEFEGGEWPAYDRMIRVMAPELSPRERQVCVGIALGLSSQGIALSLGIGLNTVLTYRRRAYARLNISSHNELLRAMFAAAMRGASLQVVREAAA